MKIVSQKGFLMVEVIVATVVISIALVAILGMYIQSTKANVGAAEYTVASNLVQKQLELLKLRNHSYWAGMDYTNPVQIPWQGSESLPITVNNVQYQISTEAVNAPENSNLVQVTVTVGWNDANLGTQSIKFTTFYRKVPL